jgi:hypothetical protein
MAGGDRIETAMVGHDSVVGISAALADPVALNTAIARTTCACYGIVKRHYDRLIAPVAERG